MMPRPESYTVSEITQAIKTQLEDEFPYVDVEGEISNGKKASSGHYYFSLKDANSMLSAVLFRNAMGKLDFSPKDGDQVKARGRISVYGQRGSYQLICSSMTRAGQGDLLLKLEERKRRLAAEGLFNQEKKKPLPDFPKTIGVITSPTGAAIRDILKVLERRGFPGLVRVLPVPVQGNEAPSRIASMIDYANHWKLGDVLIVGRGGGSLEDLLAFSEEVVVRSIAQSNIPVISGVGHEVDNALSDFAADLRAATPSAAAELVCPPIGELLDDIKHCKEMLERQVKDRIKGLRRLLEKFTGTHREETLFFLTQPKRQRLEEAKSLLLDNMADEMRNLKQRLKASARDLENLSPKEVLRRGYSIVTTLHAEDDSEPRRERTIKSSSDIKTGDRLRVIFAQGQAKIKVEEKTDEKL